MTRASIYRSVMHQAMPGRAISVGRWTAVVAFVFAAEVEAQTVLSTYTFEGASNGASSVAAGLAVDPLATGGINYLGPASGLTPPDSSTYFGWIRLYSATAGLSTDAASQTDWPGALAAGDYLSIGVAVSPGYTLSLSSATLSAGMNGFLNITAGFGFYSNVTGFTGSPLAVDFVADPTTSPTWASLTLDVSSYPNLQNLGAGNYEFRLYLADNYSMALTAQSVYLDNVQLNGVVSAVPEPSAWAALTGAAVLGAALCRCKRTSRAMVPALGRTR